MKTFVCSSVVFACYVAVATSFVVPRSRPERARALTLWGSSSSSDNAVPSESQSTRRSMLIQGISVGSALLVVAAANVESSSAAVGTLPEFSDTNAILQGLTVNVADQSQQKSMIEFLTQGFGFEVLRQRINGPIEEVVRERERTIMLFFEALPCNLALMFSFASGWALVQSNCPFLRHFKFHFHPLVNTVGTPRYASATMLRQANHSTE